MKINRIVALEEHVSFKRFTSQVDPAAIARRGFEAGRGAGSKVDDLDDVEGQRLRSMDEAGITMQVLSVVGPGADLLPPEAGPAFAREYNDELAAVVSKHPDRLSAFAHLPLSAPEAAAEELERCVRRHHFRGALISGTTNGLFLDDPRFRPILERAEALDVPLYVHPGIPPKVVRDAYYTVHDDAVSYAFANAGWGWHAETAVHILRLVLSGSLDRYPKLRLIVGHMGEGLPTMIQRCDATVGRVATHLKRSISETLLDQLLITIAGFFWEAPFFAAMLTFGVDRILFSVDYPFSANRPARDFLDALPLTPSDKIKIAHANADRALKLGG